MSHRSAPSSTPGPTPRAARGSQPLLAALLSLLLASLAGAPLLAADWPQYRGQERDGHSPETGLATSWPTGGPPVLWRAELGTGYSGLAVADGRLFTLFGNGDDEYAIAFDAASGKELWRLRTDSDRYDRFGSGPRSTPTVVGETVYVLGAKGKLYALAADSGRPRFEVDLVREHGARVPTWGVATSPLVIGRLLLIDAGGDRGRSLLALDRESGELVWSSRSDIAGYSSPLAVTVDGVRQAIFFTGTTLVAVAPADGRVLWELPWKTSYDVNAAMPILVPPDRIFASSGYDKGSVLLRLARRGDGVATEEVWRSREMKNQFNSSVLVDGHLYGFDDGTLKCVRAANGEMQWRQRGFAKGSLLYADGHLYVLGEKGKLALVEATPEEYREVSSFELFDSKTWTMPTLAGGRLFVRSEEELVALDVRRPRGAEAR